MYGAIRLIRRRSPAVSTTSILDNKAFVRLDLRRRKWLLPPLVRTILPVPVTRNRLAAALYVFILNFFVLAFGISIPHKKAPGGASFTFSLLKPAPFFYVSVRVTVTFQAKRLLFY